MQKKARVFILSINYILLAISILFYVVLLRAPSQFLLGVAVGLVVYGGCYGLIRIGWQRFVRGVLYTAYFSLFAYALYACWYVVQKV